MSTIRAYRKGDFDALLSLINVRSAPRVTMSRRGLEEFLDYPWLRPEIDLFVAPAGDGAGLAGARDVRVWARGDETVPILESWGALLPQVRDSETARDLMQAALHRASQIVGERGRERGIVQARCDTDDAVSAKLFESCGLSPARVLLTILRPDLDNLTPPRFPEGIAVRPYRVGEDEEAWVEAFNDSFADHWGGFMGMSLPLWRKYVRRPWFKPEISFVAWDGAEIAGFGHFIIHDEQNALSGKKQSLMRYIGVRPRWRRIGLGVALTRAGLLASREAGMESCLSGVDSENVQGAHHIYEREGFVTTKRHYLYRAEVEARPAPAGRRNAPARGLSQEE
jgi:mycothiol synthase